MKKAPVISIIGGTVWGNRGAEAMLATTIGRLRTWFPDARFNIFSYYPAKDRALVKDEHITILSGKPLSLVVRHFLATLAGVVIRGITSNLPQGDFFRITRALAASDVLLDIGGITFADGREKYLPFNILSIWPAMLLKVKVVKLAQAVGPFRRPLNRLCAKLFLTHCSHIFARGEQSAQFLAELGYPPEKFDLVSDIAFLYEPGFSLSSENDARVDGLVAQLSPEKRQAGKIVAISPSILVEQESRRKGLDYTGQLLDLMAQLGAGGVRFVVVPNATRQGSDKPHNNDLLTIARMKADWEIRQVEDGALADVAWVDYDINSASLRRILAQADVLVTSRYHAMIAGLCLALPTLVIGWGHKYRETMAYFGLERFSLDFSQSGVNLAEQVGGLLEHPQHVAEAIRQGLPKVRALSENQFAYLKDLLA